MNKKTGILNGVLILILMGIVTFSCNFKIPPIHFDAVILHEWEDQFAQGGGFGDKLTRSIEKAAGDHDFRRAWQLSQLYAFVYAKPEIQDGKICWTEVDNPEKPKRFCGIVKP